MPDESLEVAADILSQCSELCDQAVNADLDVLAHLLSMAMLQAAKDMETALPNGRRQKRA